LVISSAFRCPVKNYISYILTVSWRSCICHLFLCPSAALCKAFKHLHETFRDSRLLLSEAGHQHCAAVSVGPMQKSIGNQKFEPRKIVTPTNFSSKLSTCDYVRADTKNAHFWCKSVQWVSPK